MSASYQEDTSAPGCWPPHAVQLHTPYELTNLLSEVAFEGGSCPSIIVPALWAWRWLSAGCPTTGWSPVLRTGVETRPPVAAVDDLPYNDSHENEGLVESTVRYSLKPGSVRLSRSALQELLLESGGQ